MRAIDRCIRGFVTTDLIRALRRRPTFGGLSEADRALVAADLEPSAWVDREQFLRLAAAAREHVCGGDWSRFHALCAGSVARLAGLGYRAVLRSGEPRRTFQALSVLWRASFNFGRAVADTDRRGATVHLIDCATIDELEGNVHAGWCLGVAELIGAEGARLELRRRPWADQSDEQVVRLHWREPVRRPTPTPARQPPRTKLGVTSVG